MDYDHAVNLAYGIEDCILLVAKAERVKIPYEVLDEIRARVIIAFENAKERDVNDR